MSLADLDLAIVPPPPPDLSLGIGAVGAGFIMADCHLPAYVDNGYRLAAIHSRTRSTAETVAARHGIAAVHDTLDQLLADPGVDIVDIAVPPDKQLAVIEAVCSAPRRVKGILAQKPLGANLTEAVRAVQACEEAGIPLGVNQNMRYDHGIRACKTLLERGLLGEPVLATIDMRAIPHWMPWQKEMGWCTLRIMSIHHMDTFRYLFGDPERVYASVRPDPRTKFAHDDGICLYVLEYEDGLRCASCDDVWAGPQREGCGEDKGIRWRVEGTRGMARGTIGWPDYPDGSPSTIDYTCLDEPGHWFSPRWELRWFHDAFAGPMGMLMTAVSRGEEPVISGRDNLMTMALVEAAYLSAEHHAAVCPHELLEDHGIAAPCACRHISGGASAAPNE
ncbi:MAG: Gfo/Idh/MocA family oxidoreductase [Armatimonadetes bacterium]|nr:Gfo/Idh/MocA family oxidoreductase [Armatimonadota bacterium]